MLGGEFREERIGGNKLYKVCELLSELGSKINDFRSNIFLLVIFFDFLLES